MAYDALLEATKGLPEDRVYDVIAFIDFLKARMGISTNESVASTENRRHKERTLGQMRGQIRVADDFDEIPIDFAGYL